MGIVSSAATTINNPVTFHIFYFSTKVFLVVFLFFLLLLLCALPGWKSSLFHRLPFVCLSLGLAAWPRICDPFVSQNSREFYASYSPRQILSCAYTTCLYGWFSDFYTTKWFTFPIRSSIILYSFCANLLLSLIMWLIISSLSSHKLHLQFCSVLSIFAQHTWSIYRCLVLLLEDSVSLLRSPFSFSHVQVFSCEISIVCRLKSPSIWFDFPFLVVLLVLCCLCYFPSLLSVFHCSFLCSFVAMMELIT